MTKSRMPATGLAIIIGLCLPAFAFAESLEVDVVRPLPEHRGNALRLVGTVEAVQHAQLASEQSGQVEQIHVEVGDRVGKGQDLLQLEDSLAQLAVAETASRVEAATVTAEEAERLLKEVESLSERQVVAETLVEERRAALQSARAALAQEEAILAYRQKVVDKHTLRAPFDGLVENRAVSLGEWLTPQSNPFRLVSSDKFRVRAFVPQEYYFSLRDIPHPEVTVSHDKLPTPMGGLTIDRLVAVSQQSTRSMPALINLPAETGLVPGMSVSVSIALTADDSSRTWVPVNAIKVHPDGGSSLIAVVDDTAKRLKVTVHRETAEAALVAGLPAEVVVVSSGIELIKEGMSLKIVNTAAFSL